MLEIYYWLINGLLFRPSPNFLKTLNQHLRMILLRLNY